MNARYQATRAAIDLIKRFEGFRAAAAQLPDGGYTIGYGHTRTARAGVTIGEADADALLIYDMAVVVAAINEWVLSPLSQNQFDALVAFVFNIGLANFRRSSVLRRLQEGSYLQAACAMEMWRTADFEGERIVIDALVRRRSAEMALFLTPQEGYVPVPSLVIAPRVDEQVARAAPMAATQVESPLEGAIAAMVLRASEAPAEPVSAARAAADAVTARLNALLQDAPAAAEAKPPVGAPLPPVEDELAAPPPPEFDAPVLRALIEPDPESVDKVLAEPELQAEPQVREALHLQPMMFQPKPTGSLALKRPKRTPEPILALMGVAGLGIAGGGVFWGFSANAAERLPLLPDPQVTGFGVSLAGVAMLVASIYLLLTRLAMRDY